MGDGRENQRQQALPCPLASVSAEKLSLSLPLSLISNSSAYHAGFFS